MGSHGAVASYALGEEVWQAVVDDWRTAPLEPGLYATLGFLEKQTLRPDELGPGDAEAVRAAGVSEQALRDAATVCGLFNMIVRLADSLGWDVPTWDRLQQRAPAMLEGGYRLTAIGKR
jgi:alkylhydroperoxidase family enzyme